MISVVVPVYNGVNYIHEFLESCLRQKYNDFELVFVDDGSVDDSLNVLKKIQDESNIKIKLIHQENGGVCSARNKGLEAAEGEYVCFCDIDDLLSEYYLEYMFDVFTENKADLVICRMEFIKKGDKFSVPGEIRVLHVMDKLSALKSYLFGGFQSGCCTIMLRRSSLTDNRIFFPVGRKYNEDIYTLWKILSVSEKIVLIDNVLYYYRQHAGTAMSKFDQNRMDGLLLMLSLEDYFKEKVPGFSALFGKYGAARIAWSLSWQAAIFLHKNEYFEFIEKNNLRMYFVRLLTYPQLKVRLSAAAMLLSARVFRILALFNKPYRYR